MPAEIMARLEGLSARIHITQNECGSINSGIAKNQPSDSRKYLDTVGLFKYKETY